MRLVAALALATSLAAITALFQTTKPIANDYLLQSVEKMNDSSSHKSKKERDNNTSDDVNLNRWGWLWQAINKVFIFVLAGWAVGRLTMQFRRHILIFLGLVIVFDFVLVLTGLVKFALRWENIESVFQVIKNVVIGVGFVEFLSILFGLWAGVRGIYLAEQHQQAPCTG